MKKIIRGIIAVVFISITCFLLASCASNREILGVWVDDYMNKMTFEKDGTCYEAKKGSIIDNQVMKYEIEDDKLKITESALGISAVTNYTFHIEDDLQKQI